ncbi:MAG: phosphoribosylaminoimidazolesuccinocarboxamide synthase [Bacteroidetes bacterium]|jgi:phosphoribosylaminoimidazole-succinocarboxamide synthase|nr:phosphoribosylaminoimidazolesuccinocarboxamide synthase [Bacteroidota bacterium]MBT6686670.1 phosphoribosylaminoimidazolesuccinocarboxamide synthase [Bacteroidota bacterium]MBT7144088.1 phosphoribosylaminoimidazolesuccinocarboxamide synthase [Bacteroidota bacterium]MBT7492269.1 phosphoribosylaminoimidazolesuccinocarboxamide synthase [Bacteroidota bacterium]
MAIALTKSNLKLNTSKKPDFYLGKVRDVYTVDNKLLIMLVSDRISAFDIVLPKGIPFKGQVLNQIASKFLDMTSDIVPNWKISCPDPTVMIGHKVETYPIEMIIRGILTGSLWREYKNGVREIYGLRLPDGMKENQRFPEPIITPTTKAEQGMHDEPISKEEILKQNLISPEEYELLEKYTRQLFERGSKIAEDKGLILVDTKYEFGKKDSEIYLIDEIHTPDSSRYFYANGYEERFEKGEAQKQLSKEFVREWLMEQGFKGEKGQQVPKMDEIFVNEVSERYIELYEKIIGEKFVKADVSEPHERINESINNWLEENYL